MIDLNGATEITNVAKLDLGSASNTVTPVQKKQFLDIVAKLKGVGIDARLIPSKLEGVTFGPDITMSVNGQAIKKHTVYVANDNDFLTAIADPLTAACANANSCARAMVPYPNQFYVFAFDDSDLPLPGGYAPQQPRPESPLECSQGDDDEQ